MYTSSVNSSPSVNQKKKCTPIKLVSRSRTSVRRAIDFDSRTSKKRHLGKGGGIPKHSTTSKKRHSRKDDVEVGGPSTYRGKEVIELSSDLGSSFSVKVVCYTPLSSATTPPASRPTSSSSDSDPEAEESDNSRVNAIKELQIQIREDISKIERHMDAPVNKKEKFRYVEVHVGHCEDRTDPGVRVVMTGGLRFESLYKTYGKKMSYKPHHFEIWYNGRMLCLEQTLDDIGLPDKEKTVAIPKFCSMNVDSRCKVLTLYHALKNPKGERLTVTNEEPVSSLYDRVSGVTGKTLGCFLLGCRGDYLPPEGKISDTKLRNEDHVYWMGYNPMGKFPW